MKCFIKCGFWGPSLPVQKWKRFGTHCLRMNDANFISENFTFVLLYMSQFWPGCKSSSIMKEKFSLENSVTYRNFLYVTLKI